MNRLYLGIDPGKTGSTCLLHDDDTILFIDWHETIIQDLVTIKGEMENLKCLLEHQQSFPGQGVSSTCRCCFGYGQYYGALQALRIPFKTIRSQEWMRGLGVPAKLELKARKRKIAEIMLNRYPGANWTARKVA